MATLCQNVDNRHHLIQQTNLILADYCEINVGAVTYFYSTDTRKGLAYLC